MRIRDGKIRIRNPGWKKFGSGSGMEKIRIRDKHPGSATLQKNYISISYFCENKKVSDLESPARGYDTVGTAQIPVSAQITAVQEHHTLQYRYFERPNHSCAGTPYPAVQVL